MSTTALVWLFFLVSAFFYFLWVLYENKREAKHKKVLEETLELGDDIIPGSLHPQIDPAKCIGSGACVMACPEKNVLGIVGGKAQLIGPLACIGHGACATACPVGAISLVFGTEKRGLELPNLDPNFQTNQAGLYVVGELGGMGLIRNAIRQGAQAAEHIVSAGRRGGNDIFDAVVIGAGPAGISATLGLMEAGLSTVTLEREAFGGTIAHYPRAKLVMAGSLEIPLYGKVSKRRMSKEQLLELWSDIRDKTGLSVRTGKRVDHVQRDADGFYTVRYDSGAVRAANVLLALGRRGSPNRLNVPGEDLPKVNYRLLEPEEFAGKHVLVVGGGDSAVENAVILSDFGGCASVAISYRRPSFGRCRSENRSRIEQAIHEGRVTPLMSSEVTEIQKDIVFLKISGQVKPYRNDAIIVQIGGTSPRELLSSFGIELVMKFGEA